MAQLDACLPSTSPASHGVGGQPQPLGDGGEIKVILSHRRGTQASVSKKQKLRPWGWGRHREPHPHPGPHGLPGFVGFMQCCHARTEAGTKTEMVCGVSLPLAGGGVWVGIQALLTPTTC